MKKVSVIIPVYNVQEYLKECLESIINQTYKKIEIIINKNKNRSKQNKRIKKCIDKIT